MYILMAALSDEVIELKESEKNNLVFSGVGKLKAAFALSERYQKQNGLVTAVVNLGTAGSDRISSGTLVEVVKSHQRDASFFSDVVTLKSYTQLIQVTCGSGDRAEPSKDTDPWDVVDMELYSLATFCKEKSLPLVSIKYVTDRNDVNVYKEWKKQLPLASAALSAFWKDQKQQILSQLCPK